MTLPGVDAAEIRSLTDLIGLLAPTAMKPADRHVVLLGVVGQFPEQRRADGQVAYVGQQQVVTCGGRLLDGVGGEKTIGARAGINHHRLLPACAQLLADDAGDGVGAAASREGGDDAHGLAGEGLRQGLAGGQSQAEACQDGGKSMFHVVSRVL